jgi:group I intron endonuclease
MHIYRWTHKETGKTYIGQSIQDPNQRRLEHIAHSRHSEKTYHFHNAIRKYGEESFEWEVLQYASSIDELNYLEVFYMNKYDSIENGYNLREGGNNKLHSEESKKRMSEAQKAAHKRRRELGTDTFVKTRKTSGWKWTDKQKDKVKGRDSWNKGLTMPNNNNLKGKTWKMINGTRVWMEKE